MVLERRCTMDKTRILIIVLKVVAAALTALIAALTTSCLARLIF